jgi:uncharacterized protein
VTTSRTQRFAFGTLAGLLVSLTVAAQDATVSVPADDGTPLATDIYLPEIGTAWPVVLARTPYGRDGHRSVAETVAAAGLVYVVQDTRGRFGSGGVDTVFRDDGADGRATLRWIADQPWCSGRIATWGGSADGITQYMLAPGAGPELVAIAPIIATPDLYHHAFLQGGALRESLAWNWLAGQGSLYFYDEVRRHRLWDGWWAEKDVLPQSAQVTAAGLHVGGWYDIFAQGTLDAFTRFQEQGGEGARGRQRLLMGPWTHSVGERTAGELTYPAEAEVDLNDVLEAWLFRWLTDFDTGVDAWPVARVFLMGAVGEPGAPGNRWLDLPGWPPAADTLALHLSADGTLAASIPTAGALELAIDPAHPVPTLGGANLFPELVVDGRRMGAGPHDQRPIEARPDVLTFSTDALSQPLTVVGRVSCTIWVESDTPDLDLAVRLTDVYPDGRSMLVLDGIRRARSRCGDDTSCLLPPGEPTALTVDLWSTALVFNAGHRIRITVSGTNAPRFEVNPNHGGDLDDPTLAGVPARPRLRFGPDHPSRLELPIGGQV